MNDCEFARRLRAHEVSRRSYMTFLATMYPLVVGFNRALIGSIAKVDHVRQSSFLKVLAQQLEEEQAHNQLWRTMLDTFQVDHEALYDDLEEYLAGFSREELDARSLAVLASIAESDPCDHATHFPGSIFPDPVLALYHLLWSTATEPEVSYWEHFASQAGIEMIIFDVVSATVLPGVLDNADLDLGPSTTQWWREHGQPPGVKPTARIDEEKHLELSRIALNRSEAANAIAPAVAARAQDAMRLFAASLFAQCAHESRFPLDRYLK